MISQFFRVVATGFSFSVFGLGGILLSLVIFPIQTLLIRDQQKRKRIARMTVHHSFKLFVALMTLLRLIEVKTHGLNSLKAAKGKVLIANHPSLIDVVILIANMRNADCVVKSALFTNPFIKGVLNSVGYIRNDNPEQLIRDCQSSLEEGNNIVIFPEGTRTTSGENIKFLRGAANIAVRCKANYLPATVHVCPTTLTKAEPWYKVPERRVVITINVLSEMDLSSYWEANNLSLSVRKLTRHSQQFYFEELQST